MMSRIMKRSFAALFLFCAISAQAKVVDSSASSLAIKHTFTVSATPAKAWASLVDVGKWWGSDHTYSGNAANMHLDARPGGCWCETLPNGGGVQHMSVVFAGPNERLTLTGALGPMQTTGATGAMNFALAKKGDGTEVAFTYNVGGYFPGGFTAAAEIIDHVIVEQLERLERLINTGSADIKK